MKALCSSCGHFFMVPPEYIDKTVKCPHCKGAVAVNEFIEEKNTFTASSTNRTLWISVFASIFITSSVWLVVYMKVSSENKSLNEKLDKANASIAKMQNRNIMLQNTSAKLSKEISSVKTISNKSFDSLQDEIQFLRNENQSLQNDKLALIQKLNQQKEAEQKQRAISKTLKIEFVDYFNLPLKVGQVATIRDSRSEGGGLNRLVSEQVIDERNVICHLNRYKPNMATIATIWLTNFDTTGLIDNEVVECNHQFIISGQYCPINLRLY